MLKVFKTDFNLKVICYGYRGLYFMTGIIQVLNFCLSIRNIPLQYYVVRPHKFNLVGRIIILEFYIYVSGLLGSDTI